MKVTYIHHSSFCVETDGKALVFDYYGGKGLPSCEYHGHMPQLSPETPLYVFASHSHRDHFDLEVLEWSRKYPKIHYIFAKEVKRKLGNAFLERLGYGEALKEKITYVRPDEEYEIDGVTVRTLKSTDSGVAFLAGVNGRNIYHAGDLNWWKWEGESEAFHASQEKTYKEQIDRLRETPLDLAFVVIDPRQGANQYLGMDYFVKTAKAKHILPMHLWKRYELIRQYRDQLDDEALREKIVLIKEEDQEFLFD